MSRFAIAATVAESKRKHPEQFCPAERCLWRTGGNFARCPRHPAPVALVPAPPGAREAMARARKVALLFALVPRAATSADASAMADLLASWSQEDRDRFAEVAGAKSPGPVSWTLLVETVRLQPLVGEPQGRGAVLLTLLRGGRA